MKHDCSLFRNGIGAKNECRLETMHPLFHSLYKNTSVVVCKNSTHPSNRRVCNLNFPLWTCIHHRVVVYLNVSSRNMVTFSFCIFSNVVFLCLHHVKRDFAHLFALVAMHHGRIIRRVVSIEAI
jgi:hypothetical protein